MGLDVYFYNRKKVSSKIEVTQEDIIKEFSKLSDDIDLVNILMKLKNYSSNCNESFFKCLYNAVDHYLFDYGTVLYSSSPDEVAYFRKFWYLIDYFDYSDDYYGTDKPITKDQIEDLRNKAEKVIKMVQSELTYLNYIVPKEFNEFIDMNLTDSMEVAANEVCRTEFGRDDAFLYSKVVELYNQFSKILEETDFDSETIVMNADW